MRGLRTSIDQLRAVNLPLAEKFATVNRDLEALTISASPGVWIEDGQVGGHKRMDLVGRLVVKQWKLVEERDTLISQIRAQPGFNSFLIPPSFDTLRSAAAGGPVILINHSEWHSDIIILLHDSPPLFQQMTIFMTMQKVCMTSYWLHEMSVLTPGNTSVTGLEGW